LGEEPAIERRLTTEMQPYGPAQSGGDVDVVLARVSQRTDRGDLEFQHAAGDGLVTAVDGSSLFLLEADRLCRIPDAVHDSPARFEYEPGFPGASLFSVARTALQLAFPRHDAVAIHAASVEVDGRAVAVAGWSESGKTETALALMEGGAVFLSDKWSVLTPAGGVAAFPIGIGIRRWVLPYLPTLRRALPVRARLQLGLAGVAGTVSAPLRARRSGGRIGALAISFAERAVALADRAGLTPAELRAAYGVSADPLRQPPLNAVALLCNTRGPGVRITAIDPAVAARRLVRTAAFERRPYFALRQRASYALTNVADDGAADAMAREEAILTRLLGGSKIFRVDTPFPTDPRRVAEALAAVL
jgi:hypothetical protein